MRAKLTNDLPEFGIYHSLFVQNIYKNSSEFC